GMMATVDPGLLLGAERAEVAGHGRALVRDGLVVGSAGNLSARAGDRVAISPSGVGYDQVEPASVCVVDLAGRPVDGSAAPSSELPMHLAAYRATGAGAVVHTHSPFVTALSTVVEELPAIHYGIVELGGPIRVAPYATFGTEELAANLARALEGRRAAILQSHGGLTWAETLPRAYRAAVLLEWLAATYWRARLVGEPRILTGPELEAVGARFATAYGQPRPPTRG
ncbi:MAG: class II aldolase/adducin family protein, partial [Acidimicrobiales bacterium]